MRATGEGSVKRGAEVGGLMPTPQRKGKGFIFPVTTKVALAMVVLFSLKGAGGRGAVLC